MSDDTTSYQFSPRPEAHAMNWSDLLPPVRHAVRDLLIRIDGAVSSSEANGLDGKIVSNSFLVYGSRGTGKTTVLHSAKKAVCDAGNGKTFFYGSDSADPLQESAQKSASELDEKKIIWLDILDLEPLPKKANLLTILLTRVLDALEQSNCHRENSVPRSIFEEDSESARHQLRQLINDATLLWEDVHEADTRNIANRQIEAADIYTNCCKKFKKAMDTLSKELGQFNSRDKGCSIILPIDNIDRSTDHLQSLVKLAQMVSHPKLWLVMAGDRIEVETFLERAYWKELIHSDDSAGAQGKLSSGGEDEALVMARLQATAVAQKIWPPNHRLEANLVRPLDTLKFSPNKTKEMTVSELLEEVNIPTTGDQRKGKKGDQKTIKLINLFEIQDKLGTPSVSNDKDKILLTRAAQHGLRLPARAVLDLWQLANWVVNDLTTYDTSDFRAEKIARTMLRNVIAASRVSSKAGLLLQNENIRRTDNGGTQLNFIDYELKLRTLYKEYFHLHSVNYSPKEEQNRKFALRSQLSFDNEEDLLLFLNTRIYSDDGKKNKWKELSHPAAAWLMILYDILILAEFEAESVVLSRSFLLEAGSMVPVTYEVYNHALNNLPPPDPIRLSWPKPTWSIFLAHDMFSQRWMQLCSKVKEKLLQKNINKEVLSLFLVANWISCILETFVSLNSDCDDKIKNRNEIINQTTKSLKLGTQEGLSSILKDLELTDSVEIDLLYINTIESAIYMYFVLKENNQGEDTIKYKEQDALEDWLEEKLPLLLSHLYVPLDNKPPVLNVDEIKKRIQDSKDKEMGEDTLIDYWVKNSHFIQANIASELVNIFPDNGDTMEKNSSNHDYSGFINNQMTWALGVNLSQLLNSDSSQTGS